MGLSEGAKGAAKVTVEVSKASVIGFWRGLTYPFKGARLVYGQHPGLVRYWAFPIVITIVAFALIGWGACAGSGAFVDWVWSPPTDPGFWGGFARVIHWIFEALLVTVIWLLGAALVVTFSNVIAAPFNDLLSEEVEAIVTKKPQPTFSLKILLRDTVRSLGLEIVKLLIYLTVMVPTFLLSLLLPVAGQIIYSIFAFLFTALYFAIDFLDWPASRRNRSIAWRFTLLGRHFMPLLGFGTGVWLLLFFPLVNLLFMPAAVAGGTMLFLDLEAEARGAAPQPEAETPLLAAG